MNKIFQVKSNCNDQYLHWFCFQTFHNIFLERLGIHFLSFPFRTWFSFFLSHCHTLRFYIYSCILSFESIIRFSDATWTTFDVKKITLSCSTQISTSPVKRETSFKNHIQISVARKKNILKISCYKKYTKS